MENLVEIKDVSFAYGFRPVLKGINMAVPRGKVVSIMGLSGCGKTTLLRLIAGAIKPRRGEVRVAGRVINRMRRKELYAERRKMGMLYQFGALFTDMTALENVAFQIREHTDLPEDMVQDLAMMKLNAVGLRGAHHMMPAELSGGMARRVALARAIALDPTLIMYDEPFTGLDPISLGVISNLLRRLNDVLGATSIVVTHDVQETLKIVDYVYFMADGAVVAQGTPDEIRESKMPFVHQFIWGEIDGPLPFHMPGGSYAKDLALEAARA
jgi:phospholipid/cholesterol/gamma-HCH transport system ATP-binding protein